MSNALTVDVEDYYHVAAFAKAIRRHEWDRRVPRVEANTHRLLELFAEHRVRATFFVLGWVAERFPSLVRAIADQGHEVASHGYSHQLIYRQPQAEFRQETLRAKGLLEDIAQCHILGYRAASYSITERSLWALDLLVEAGFTYDSSIFPIRHDHYGIPSADPAPGLVRTPGGTTLVEFPPTTLGLVPGWRLPVGGGGYFRLYPYRITAAALRIVNRTRPFMFYVHPWEVDPDQPRVRAGALSRFRHYLNLHRCEHRLRRLLQEFEMTSAAGVLSRLKLIDAPAGMAEETLYA